MSNYIYINSNEIPEYWNENWNSGDFIVVDDTTTRKIQTNDFKGFYFNGHHSSEFNIIRTSSSKRYNENITNNLNDKTVDVPNGDGKYYFGTTFKEKTFSISYAFDNITENGLKNMKFWLNGKELGGLIFDEEPYKVYTAKPSKSQIKYLCFNENEQRIYKGEGSIDFICYYPFARTADNIIQIESGAFGSPQDGRIITSYSDSIFTNKIEWEASSRLHTDYIINSNEFLNLGDLPTPFILTYTPTSGTTIEPNSELSLNYLDNKIGSIKFRNQLILNGEQDKLEWNSKTGIVKLYNTANPNGQIIRYVGDGIIKLPVTNITAGTIIKIDDTIIIPQMKYNYLYY